MRRARSLAMYDLGSIRSDSTSFTTAAANSYNLQQPLRKMTIFQIIHVQFLGRIAIVMLFSSSQRLTAEKRVLFAPVNAKKIAFQTLTALAARSACNALVFSAISASSFCKREFSAGAQPWFTTGQPANGTNLRRVACWPLPCSLWLPPTRRQSAFCSTWAAT